jgi:hypothetical protein
MGDVDPFLTALRIMAGDGARNPATSEVVRG